MESYHIQSYCHIRDQEISLNGTSIFKSGETNFADFIKSAYKILDTHYPKFFKMDSLSKLAFMATEVLLTSETEKNMALVVSNRAASLETDRKHYNSLVGDNPYASPALFVYTLPNICLGEISIRHGLLSENSFFIFEDFNAEVKIFKYKKTILMPKFCRIMPTTYWLQERQKKHFVVGSIWTVENMMPFCTL